MYEISCKVIRTASLMRFSKYKLTILPVGVGQRDGRPAGVVPVRPPHIMVPGNLHADPVISSKGHCRIIQSFTPQKSNNISSFDWSYEKNITSIYESRAEIIAKILRRFCLHLRLIRGPCWNYCHPPLKLTVINQFIDLTFISCRIATVEVESLFKMVRSWWKTEKHPTSESYLKESLTTLSFSILLEKSSPRVAPPVVEIDVNDLVFYLTSNMRSKVKPRWSVEKDFKKDFKKVMKTFAFAVIAIGGSG